MSEKSNPASREASLRRKKHTGYHYRRRSKATFADQYNGELKHVLGFTLKSNCAFTCDPNTGLLAYPAGCVIVLYNPRCEKQSHIFNSSQKTLTCLRFSNDGNFIVTGETGHQPCVRVFSVIDRCHVTSFSSHKFGVSCVAFSPNGKYVISIGYQHDNVINVWDWRKNKLAASNKVSTKVKSVAFSEDNSYFVTVGNRHVKFWYLEKSSDKSTVPLKGRSAILESLRNHIFCDVICAVGGETKYTFAITRSGMLCQFNAGRTVEKYVELKCGSARSMCIIDEMILCGCASGSVHVFNSDSLEFITEIFPPKEVRGYEVVATSIDIRNMWMHCVFSDHSLLVYDIMDFSSPRVQSLFQFHNSCVWDVKVVPSSSECNSLPKDCFLTCSNDGTTRAWQCKENECELLKVVTLDESHENINDESSTKYEARTLCIRYDAKHLAIGDRAGNIHVYNLENFEKLTFIHTHEGDILCMDYSNKGNMLASASRDRCVHTFESGYAPTHTIADHSAAVTSVKFAHHENDFRLITCGSDKSLYFCAITSNAGKTEISREQHFVEKHSMSDMAVLEDSVLVACGANVSEYDIIGGKLRRSFRGNESTATILRVAVDNQRTMVALSCADKNIYVLGFMTTECLCVLAGHSEVAVALTFDLENRLLSASADSCVFVWVMSHRVSDDLRNLQITSTNSSSNLSTPDSPDLNKTEYFGTSDTLHLELDEKVDDSELTPRPLNGESLPALFSSSSQQDEPSTFEAVCDTMSTPQSFGLPKWLTQKLSTDNEGSLNPTPRSALGKWGNKLEHEKVCEEIGNLARTSDVLSVISSVDGEVVSSDDEDASQTYIKSKKIEVEPRLETNVSLINEACDEVEGSKTTELQDEKTEKPPQESDRSRIDVTFDIKQSVKEEIKDNSSMSDESDDSNKENDLNETRCLQEKYLKPSEKNKFQSRKRNSLSLQDEINNVSENNSALKPKSQTNEPTLVISSKPTIQPDLMSGNFMQVNVVDEDVDIRRVLYMNNANRNALAMEKPCQESSEKVQKTMVNGDVQRNDADSIPNTELSLELNDHVDSKPKELIDVATRDLINNVLASVECESKTNSFPPSNHGDNIMDDSLNICNPENVDSELQKISPQKPQNETSNGDKTPNVHVCHTNQHGKSDTSYNDSVVSELQEFTMQVEPDKTQNNVTTEKLQDDGLDDLTMTENGPGNKGFDNDLLPVTLVSNLQCESKVTPFKIDNLNEKYNQTATEKTPAMPPAFVELLASLTKKRTSRVHPASPPKSLGARREYRSDEEYRVVEHQPNRSLQEGGDHYNNFQPFKDQRSDGVESMSYGSNDSSVENNNNHYPANNTSCNEWHDAELECHKISEDLLTVFNQAEAAYYKQKAYNEPDTDVANGNLSGFNKLVRSLQTIHSRIGRLKVTKVVQPESGDQLSSRSVSLESLSDESSVFSLLREYSDRLVDLVNTRVDHRDGLTTQADTI